VQAEKLNRSSFPTVMVCPLTSNLDLAAAPGNVLIKAGESGLTRDSVVQVQQIITVNKANLKLQAGSIPGHLMLAVDMGLAGSLDLE
jgi:mRNA interferase MazF